MQRLILFLLALTVFTLSCHKKKKEEAKREFPVEVQAAIKKDAPIFIESVGHIESINSVEVKSRVDGELTGVYFKEGDYVKKGDLLFTIDPRPFEAKLKQTQGVLEENIANLALAEDKVLRYAALVKEEYFSEIDYEQLTTNVQTTKGAIKQNEGEVEEAALNLEYCWIYSPINGKTGILQIDYGNLIKANDSAIITINQIEPIYVTFSVPEINFPKIMKYHNQNPLKVWVSFDHFKEGHIEGCLELIDNTVDKNTGQIKLRGIFDNLDKQLWPGLFVRSRLILYWMSDAILIPFEAVVMTQSGPIVYVLKEGGNTVELRKLKLGQREDDNIIVLDGVKENEKVVIDGQINLSDGSTVKIQKAPKQKKVRLE